LASATERHAGGRNLASGYQRPCCDADAPSRLARDPALTLDAAVNELKNRPATRTAIRDAIVARAPANAVAGGSAALAGLVDGLFDDWIRISDEQSAGGNVFGYANRQSPHRLLHMPLAPEIPNLSAPHQRFVAGRSMRDVEPSVAVHPRDPKGQPIANADDLG
jgi:hypothetical protein